MSQGEPAATLGVHEDDLVTGDAVALRLPAAGPGPRILGGVVDAAVYVLALVGVLVAVGGLVGGVDEALGSAVMLTTVVGMLVGVPLAVEVLTKGRSLGRLATGTCIVRVDGGPVAPRQSLARALVGFLEIWGTTGAIATIAVLVSRRGQRLGDLAAGTCCVRERLRLQLPPPVAAVPELEGWVRSADVAPLPDDLALAVRRLVHQRDVLVPHARDRLAEELLAAVAPFVSPAAPRGAAPVDVLRSVLAERSRRDRERLAREAELRHRLLG